jgi:hypothetical protein
LFSSALYLANLLLSLSFFPYFRNTHGVKQKTVAIAAMMLVATFDPSPEYIGYAKRGMQPDAMPRRNATTAIPEEA